MDTDLLNVFRIILKEKKKKKSKTITGLQTYLPSIKEKKKSPVYIKNETKAFSSYSVKIPLLWTRSWIARVLRQAGKPRVKSLLKK